MYSREYRCTRVDTKKTTTNIVDVSESNRKTHFIVNMSTVIQERGSKTTQVFAHKRTSKKIKRDKRKLAKIKIIDNNAEPALLKRRPRSSKLIEDNNGKNISNKYIHS